MADVVCPSRSSVRIERCDESAVEFEASLHDRLRQAETSDDRSIWVRRETNMYLMGMPQLCLAGLSETWLLKELGHRHWMMLAHLSGQKTPSFVDERGAPVYAAFCAVSIHDAEFGAARENDNLSITSRLRRLSRTQMLSEHRLDLSGRDIGRVEMVSAFVRRSAGGGNHSVSRFAIPGLPLSSRDLESNWLFDRAAELRAGRADSHMGFEIGQRRPLARSSFDPCPSQDFNGAGLLYFSSFVSFADRAEWMLAETKSTHLTTVRRDAFFLGNIDPGETLAVELIELRNNGSIFAHHCQIVSERDGTALARIFTVRRAH